TQIEADVSSQLDSMANMQILMNKKFCNVPQRYAVQECDATMFNRINKAGGKKYSIYNAQCSIFNANARYTTS
ncbi:MAG: hypothetical protein WAR80_07750, partial [Ferruginibacter sp.]